MCMHIHDVSQNDRGGGGGKQKTEIQIPHYSKQVWKVPRKGILIHVHFRDIFPAPPLLFPYLHKDQS